MAGSRAFVRRPPVPSGAILLNQNLDSHTVRLRVSPSQDLTVNLLYYHFTLDEAEALQVAGGGRGAVRDVAADFGGDRVAAGRGGVAR